MQDATNDAPTTSSFIVTARDGECLDALVWRTTGQGIELTEKVLADNPGLAAQAAALPEGTAVRITVSVAGSTPPTIILEQLWD